jgi:hypothetical protein
MSQKETHRRLIHGRLEAPIDTVTMPHDVRGLYAVMHKQGSRKPVRVVMHALHFCPPGQQPPSERSTPTWASFSTGQQAGQAGMRACGGRSAFQEEQWPERALGSDRCSRALTSSTLCAEGGMVGSPGRKRMGNRGNWSRARALLGTRVLCKDCACIQPMHSMLAAGQILWSPSGVI